MTGQGTHSLRQQQFIEALETLIGKLKEGRLEAIHFEQSINVIEEDIPFEVYTKKTPGDELTWKFTVRPKRRRT